MLKTFLATLNPMLVIFLCLLTGFILRRTKRLPENSDKVLSQLETYVLVPALSFSTFLEYGTPESLMSNLTGIMYASVAILLALGIAIPLSNLFPTTDYYQRNIYRYSLTFANYGFMGNAIVPVILGGQEYLYRYLLFTLPFSFVIYLWGLPILIPKEHRKGNVLKNLFNFPMIMVMAGLLCALTGLGNYLPGFVTTTVGNLKNCMGPIAMVLTGFVIGGYSFKDMLTNKKVYIATGLRLLILPAIILGVLYLLGASKDILMLAFFAFATPLGMNTVVFPAAFGGETKTGASMAMISHVLCIITIPLLYALLSILPI